MAGHSHSANIKFRKDRVDARRAKAFSKMARNIAVAAKLGGGDPDSNPRLRLAIDKARLVNMPKDNIERAIKKGTGEGDTGEYEEAVYEGYGPGGVAVMLEILTDNRNRTAPEIRKLFEKSGGSLAAAGAVAWMFDRKGVFAVDPEAGLSEDKLLEIVLETGAEDLLQDDGRFEIHCAASDFSSVQSALESAGVALAGGEVAYVPQNRVPVGELGLAQKVIQLLEALDDHDDVQSVHSNEEFTDSVAAELEGSG